MPRSNTARHAGDRRRGLRSSNAKNSQLAVRCRGHLRLRFSDRAVPLGGSREALLGTGLALLVYIPLFALRAVGGGDVKLMAAVGSMAGPKAWIAIFLITAIAGGVIAMVLIVGEGQDAAHAQKCGRSADRTSAFAGAPQSGSGTGRHQRQSATLAAWMHYCGGNPRLLVLWMVGFVVRIVHVRRRVRTAVKAHPAATAAERPAAENPLQHGVKPVALRSADVTGAALRTFCRALRGFEFFGHW